MRNAPLQRALQVAPHFSASIGWAAGGFVTVIYLRRLDRLATIVDGIQLAAAE
jgi:hypothetical protein